MAKLPIAANTPENNQGLDDFSPIPAGDYVCQITKSEYRQTKDKKGRYLQLNWKVVKGKEKGRILFERLNLDNANEIAVEIAHKTLNTICKCCDKIGVEDSEELHGIPVKVRVGVTKGDANNPPNNEIKGYSKATQVGIEAEAEPVSTPDTQPQQEVAEGPVETSKKLPWE